MVELLPKHQWVAPSSVVLQDEGQNEDDIEKEEERERIVRKQTGFIFVCVALINLLMYISFQRKMQ